MPTSRDQAMLVRVATLYYLDGKSQAEVASETGMTRSNVSRVLATARRQGIVDIRINDPFSRAAELESELIRVFGLRDCQVAPTGGVDSEGARVGALASEWLLENLPSDGAVALSWGGSVQAVVDSVDDDPTHEGIEILPLVGGLSILDSARDANVLVRSLANKLGAGHRRLYAPAVVESPETRNALLREPSIRDVLADASKAKIAIVGLGRFGEGASAAIIESMKLDRSSMAALRAAGTVGDCCTRFFDIDGHEIPGEVNDRVVGIDLETLKTIPTVVAVASGEKKDATVYGALRGGFIDILIIDVALAASLLEFALMMESDNPMSRSVSRPGR